MNHRNVLLRLAWRLRIYVFQTFCEDLYLTMYSLTYQKLLQVFQSKKSYFKYFFCLKRSSNHYNQICYYFMKQWIFLKLRIYLTERNCQATRQVKKNYLWSLLRTLKNLYYFEFSLLFIKQSLSSYIINRDFFKSEKTAIIVFFILI